jgi:hypothetical protein
MEKTAGKTIPVAILFTRTSAAIRPRSLQPIEVEFASSGVRVLETQMHERDAFRAIFSFGKSLSDLDRGQVGNVAAAIANARANTPRPSRSSSPALRSERRQGRRRLSKAAEPGSLLLPSTRSRRRCSRNNTMIARERAVFTRQHSLSF